MDKQPDIRSLKAYAEAFALKVCDDFFAGKDAVEGEDMLELTPVEQVNLFVVRRIYEEWQQEALRIQSPLFDYRSQGVQQALGRLMNELSSHILVERKHFEPILTNAVVEALQLLTAPGAFYQALWQRQAAQVPVERYLRPVMAYIRYHKAIAEEMLSSMEGRVEVDRDELLSVSAAVCGQQVCPVDEAELALYATVVPLDFIDPVPSAAPASTLTHQAEEVAVERVGSAETSTDVMEELEKTLLGKDALKEEDDFLQKLEKELGGHFEPPAEDEAVIETEQQEPAQEIAGETLTPQEQEEPAEETEEEEAKPVEDTAATEPVAQAPSQGAEEPEVEQEENQVSQPAPVAPKEEEGRRKEGNLLTKLQEERQKEEESKKSTLKDTLAQQKPFSQKVPLNKRLLFQKEMFDGSKDALDHALQLVDGSGNYHEALQALKLNYARRYEWDYASEVVLDFIGMVDAHF